MCASNAFSLDLYCVVYRVCMFVFCVSFKHIIRIKCMPEQTFYGKMGTSIAAGEIHL